MNASDEPDPERVPFGRFRPWIAVALIVAGLAGLALMGLPVP